MSPPDAYNREKGEEEHILPLPNNRQLAYAHNGPPTSRTVILFFTGLMSVGTAPNVPESCRQLDAHWISPTLPGMGNSSTRDQSVSYHVSLARDMTALLSHMYPTGAFGRLYLAGGSYGTVQAQMLFGAPYELFPYGRKVVGCVLLAGFSPFKYHTQYAKSLNWQNWFSVGPPTQLLPFRPLQRLFKSVVGSKLNNLEGAETFLRQTLIDEMGEEEKASMSQWLKDHDMTEEQFISKMAAGTIKCCQNWDGFMEVSDVIHSDWGFDPRTLDDEHASKPMLIVGSKDDHVGGSTNSWMVENYKSAKAKVIPGGHISSLFCMNEIWQEMISSKYSVASSLLVDANRFK